MRASGATGEAVQAKNAGLNNAREATLLLYCKADRAPLYWRKIVDMECVWRVPHVLEKDDNSMLHPYITPPPVPTR